MESRKLLTPARFRVPPATQDAQYPHARSIVTELWMCPRADVLAVPEGRLTRKVCVEVT